jgi:hypothetical protein
MFYPQNKTILVHIPKTGGTSLEIAISKHFLKKESYDFLHENHTIRGKFENLKKDTPKGHRHSFISEYDRYLDLKEYESFVVLREPLSQVLSLYRQLRQNEEQALRVMPSLKDFIFGNCKNDLRHYDFYSNQYKFTHINNELKINNVFIYEKYHEAQEFVEKLYNIKIDKEFRSMKTTDCGESLSYDMEKEIKKILPETFDLYNRFSSK